MDKKTVYFYTKKGGNGSQRPNRRLRSQDGDQLKHTDIGIDSRCERSQRAHTHRHGQEKTCRERRVAGFQHEAPGPRCQGCRSAGAKIKLSEEVLSLYSCIWPFLVQKSPTMNNLYDCKIVKMEVPNFTRAIEIIVRPKFELDYAVTLMEFQKSADVQVPPQRSRSFLSVFTFF